MKILHSIRWKINFFQTLLLLCVVLSLLYTYYYVSQNKFIAVKDKELQNLLMLALPVLRHSPTINHPWELHRERRHPDRKADDRIPENTIASENIYEKQTIQTLNQPLTSPPTDTQKSQKTETIEKLLDTIEKNNFYVVVKDPRSKQEIKYGNVDESISINSYYHSPEQYFITKNGNRELVFYSKDKELVVLGSSLSDVNKQLAEIRKELFLIGISIMCISIVIGWFVSGEIVKPIDKIGKTAKEITQGEHHKRIELSDAPSELQTLAQALNNSFDHLQNIIDAQARFSADASHELRTPISVVIAQTQTALKKERTPEAYQKVLQACLRAGQRMKSMANSLLDLQQSSSVCISNCNLQDLLANIYDEIKYLSEKHKINIKIPENSLILELDAEKIRQAIMNLVSNAIQHNPQGCSIWLVLKQQEEKTILQIIDNGIGIPSEALPHIFDRFYRIDKSRSRENGGAGLGLSIVKNIVKTHGATIEVSSTIYKGTTFTISFPN